MTKRISILFMMILLQGCATITMTKVGDDVTWKSTTLWKDIEAVDAFSGPEGFNFGLGASKGSLSAEQTQMLMCLLNPTLCK